MPGLAGPLNLLPALQLINSNDPNEVQRGFIATVQYQSSLTAQAADSTPSIAKLKREHKEQLTFAVVTLLELTARQFNLNDNKNLLDPLQLTILATQIIDTYYYFKIGDIALCFREGVKGSYGPIFDRLDAQIIFTWLRHYDQTTKEEIRNKYIVHDGRPQTEQKLLSDTELEQMGYKPKTPLTTKKKK